ncbi:MAG: hypothetical protein BWZ02_02921 [Lentisphaerae bacterium ADurb.BinA184]|nr:MAG: hypothetical protein BWZ02_02921 [Lentisphaerae bacterium ADurb.BinA184]
MKINICLYRPKSENPRAPDYAGDVPLPSKCPCCNHTWDRYMRLAVWRREGKDGKPAYVSGALEDAADRPERATKATSAPPRHDATQAGAGYAPSPQNAPERPMDRPAEPPPRAADGTELPF